MEKKLLVPSCYVLWIIVISLFYIPTAEGGGKAEFKLEGMDHAIFLPVIINDLPYELLFDTGATFTVLDSSFKPLLGKPIDKSVVETTVGKTDIDMYKPVGISAGSLDLSNKHAFLLTDFDFPFTVTTSIKRQLYFPQSVILSLTSWVINIPQL